jgi:MYXO-CTERM domain-containing protein
MDAPRLLRAAALLALALAAAAPAASAHTSVFSADGKVRVVVGQLNEPVSTYAVSGLDVCFQSNTTARTPVAGVNPGSITAVLRAPNAAQLKQDLKAQFGRAGCFTFSEPYVLTMPGQYVVDLSGIVNGSAISFTGVAAGGAVVDRSDITFPEPSVPSDAELQAKVTALEARVASLEATHTSSDSDKKSPAPVAAWMMVGLAALAATRRRR